MPEKLFTITSLQGLEGVHRQIQCRSISEDCIEDICNQLEVYLTLQRVQRVLQEEIQRVKRTSDPAASEPFGKVHNTAEKPAKPGIASEAEGERVKELERENLDLKIANRGNDLFIDQLQKERNSFFDQPGGQPESGLTGNQVATTRIAQARPGSRRNFVHPRRRSGSALPLPGMDKTTTKY